MIKKIAKTHSNKQFKNLKSSKLFDHFVNSLNLNDVSQQIEKLKENIFSGQENDGARIQFIKDEIASGRYQIYEEQIASKLIESAKVKQPELA